MQAVVLVDALQGYSHCYPADHYLVDSRNCLSVSRKKRTKLDDAHFARTRAAKSRGDQAGEASEYRAEVNK